MNPLECPDCGLLNPPGAMRCDCGYDFTIGKAVNEAVRVPTTKKSYNFQSAALLTKQIFFFGCAAAGVGLARQGFYSLSYTSGLEAWLLALVGCAIAPPSAYAFWRARRRRLRLRSDFDQQHRLTEAFPFILYLRSFGSDDTRRPTAVEELLGAHLTDEQMLVKNLTKRLWCGQVRVLAVGRPGEELPPLGCTRYCFSNEEWKDEVSDLLHKASAVLLRPGITPAVLWETEKLLSCLPPQRVYVLVPSADDQYELWRDKTANIFPHPLPKASEAGDLIGFDDIWKPTLASRGVGSIQWMLNRVMTLPRLI